MASMQPATAAAAAASCSSFSFLSGCPPSSLLLMPHQSAHISPYAVAAAAPSCPAYSIPKFLLFSRKASPDGIFFRSCADSTSLPCYLIAAAHRQCKSVLCRAAGSREIDSPQQAAPNLGMNAAAEVNEAAWETGVVIVGAGLAGLAAARHLQRQGVPFLVLEASDGVGGRVRTDIHQGFVLDRGFQIFISAYPEAQQVLQYDKLDLQSFYAGALVWYGGRFHRVADPFRHPLDGLVSLSNPIGSIFDKILVGIVRLKAAIKPVDDILSADEIEIAKKLKREGFSSSMVDRFFRPFFGGIFFDTELSTTSRLFEFVFKCLALGSNTLPAEGIAAIPRQLADNLPADSLQFNSRVMQLLTEEEHGFPGVRLDSGRVVRGKYGVIVAVEAPEAVKLLGKRISEAASISKPPRSTVCLYFSAEKAPINDPILLLNGSGKGIVNNMFFPSNVSPSYAPQGKALVSVSLVGSHSEAKDEELEKTVRLELSQWFGSPEVAKWQHIRTYRIPFAQPNQTPSTNLRKEPRVGNKIYMCGDHQDSATFDGALVSGRRVAEAVLLDSKLVTV
ncbi:hypothetical protein O6H91_15G043000 [Diphasiastrum complanatum]|nr:hypothetical protein O6H91_15G043000 [Diphasiastrum complanatum]